MIIWYKVTMFKLMLNMYRLEKIARTSDKNTSILMPIDRRSKSRNNEIKKTLSSRIATKANIDGNISPSCSMYG